MQYKVLAGQYEITKEGIDGLLSCLEKLRKNIKKLTRSIEQLASKDEGVKRLMSIPGVGTITAIAFKIEIDDPMRFNKSRAVGAYLGMTPKQYSSEESQKQGRISKYGLLKSYAC